MSLPPAKAPPGKLFDRPALLGLAASLLILFALQGFFFSRISTSWRTHLYPLDSMNDTRGTIWFSLHLQKKGPYGKPDPHPLFALNDLLAKPPLSSMIFNWFLPELDHEFDVTYEDYKRVVIFQMLLTVLIAVLLFSTAKIATASNAAATLTSLFYVLDLPSVTMGFYIYTDLIFTFFLVAGLASFILSFEGAVPPLLRRVLFIGSAVWWGLATLTRLNSLYFFAPVAVAAAAAVLKERSAGPSRFWGAVKPFLKRYAVWFLVFGGIVSWRHYQVWRLTGKAFFSLNGIYAAGSKAEIMSEVERISFGDAYGRYMARDFLDKVHESGDDVDRIIELNQTAAEEYVKTAKAHPAIVFRQFLIHASRLFNTAGRTQIGDVLGEQPSMLIDRNLVARPWLMLKPENLKIILGHPRETGLIWVVWVWTHLFFLYVCSAAAALFVLKRLVRGDLGFPLWAFTAFLFFGYLAFFYSLVNGVVRYRVPIIPELALLAGWGGTLISERMRRGGA